MRSGPRLMEIYELIFYTRKGCCLCRDLEDRLLRINLLELTPPLTLKIIDIDSKSCSKEIKKSYDLKVPILALFEKNNKKLIELPRISPRIDEKDTFKFLQKYLNKIVNYGI